MRYFDKHVFSTDSASFSPFLIQPIWNRLKQTKHTPKPCKTQICYVKRIGMASTNPYGKTDQPFQQLVLQECNRKRSRFSDDEMDFSTGKKGYVVVIINHTFPTASLPRGNDIEKIDNLFSQKKLRSPQFYKSNQGGNFVDHRIVCIKTRC